MNQQQRFEAALESPNPGTALRNLALELSGEGLPRAEVYALFERFLLDLRAREQPESDQEIVMDVMDALTGWCHPSAQLLTDEDHP
jgi:hypothetical protein